MSCGCGGGGAPPTTDTEGARERAAICRACPEALYHGWEAIGCTVSGRAIEDHVARGTPCPIGSHPGDGGITRWCGVTWYGVPFPVRVWARFTARTRPALSGWRGCGCVRWAKDWWIRLAGARTS